MYLLYAPVATAWRHCAATVGDRWDEGVSSLWRGRMALWGTCRPLARMLRRSVRRREHAKKRVRWVAYLLLADNVSKPLPDRLYRVHQPVISMPNVFSTPRPVPLGCLCADLSRSTPRSSPSAMF